MISTKYTSQSLGVFVSPAKVSLRRLDSRYYSPQNLEDERKLSKPDLKTTSLGKLASLIKDGPGGWAFKANEYTTSGIPVIRASDLENGLDLSNAVFITPERHEDLKQTECLAGDLVISVRGTIGRAAVITSNITKANINADVVRVRLKKEVINAAYFIAAYLNSYIGRRVTGRIANGAVQNNMNLSEVRSIPIPFPDRRIQNYIGAKVELAERCRAEAIRLRYEANSVMHEDWGWGKVEFDIASSRPIKAHYVNPDRFDDRLDSEFYKPLFTQLEITLNSIECWTLQELAGSAMKGVQPIYDIAGIIPALTVTHIDPFVIDTRSADGRVTKEWLENNDRANVKVSEILITVTGPPLGETVVAEDFHLPVAVNSHIARFIPIQ